MKIPGNATTPKPLPSVSRSTQSVELHIRQLKVFISPDLLASDLHLILFRIPHLISSQSLKLGGRRGTTDDVATIPFHPSLSSAALRISPSPFPSIPWCCRSVSSSVFLSFLPLSLPLAELSSPCQRILRCGHAIWVSVSLPWLGKSSHGLCRKCSEVSYSISSQGLGSFSRFLLSRSSSHRHKGRWIRWAFDRLNLRSKRDPLVPPYALQSRKICCCLGYPGEQISGFDPSLEMIAPRNVKYSTSSRLWPFILISLWKPLWLFVITFVLSGPISILTPVVVVSRRSTRTSASSTSSAFTIMSSAKRKLVISHPLMLSLPSWSSNALHMILSRKILKRVGENKHICRTPTVVLNHSPVLSLNRTALWALSYRFSIARMMLALMSSFAYKASCHTLSKAFLKFMKTW